MQGAGSALIMPLALALLSTAFPPEKRGAAIGMFSAITGLAVASGPLVGGAVVQGINWQWIFWINVPIGAGRDPARPDASCEESHGPDTSLDLPGLALVTGGALGIVWALVRGNQVGWRSVETIATLGGRCPARAAFVGWERRAREPMLPIEFFRSRAFSAGNAAIFFTFASLFGRRVLLRPAAAGRARATARSAPACGCCRGRRRSSRSRRSPARWPTGSASGR